MLEVLAQEEAPVVCLEWTPGKLDILAPGVAYVASLEDASSNLLAHHTEAQWRDLTQAWLGAAKTAGEAVWHASAER